MRSPHPPIVLLAGGALEGRSGAYNRQTRCIEVSAALAWSAALGDAEASWLLVAVLIEEFGHYLDDWLREGAGDAQLDEGARFGWAMVNLDMYRKTGSEFAVLVDGAGTEYPISVDFSRLRSELTTVFDEEARRSDERDAVREYFGPAPSAERLRAGAQLAMSLSAIERVDKMNAIGAPFGMPAGAWPTGQSRVFVGGDVRIAALLRQLCNEPACRAAAVNLDRAQRHTSMDPYLVLTTAARENASSVTSLSNTMINTCWEGGLDFLWTNKNKLGLPRSVTDKWAAAPPMINPETGNEVHPGLIPAKDQVLGYAVQTKLSFTNWEKYVKRALGDPRGQVALSTLTEEARSVWHAYAFVSPAGRQFDPLTGPQHGQKFGVNSAFGYLADKASRSAREIDLNEIVSDSSLEQTDYVRIAKARAIEAAFISHYVSLAAASSTGSAAAP